MSRSENLNERQIPGRPSTWFFGCGKAGTKTRNYKKETRSTKQTTIRSIKSMCFAFYLSLSRHPSRGLLLFELLATLANTTLFSPLLRADGRRHSIIQSLSVALREKINVFHELVRIIPLFAWARDRPSVSLTHTRRLRIDVQTRGYFHNFHLCIPVVVC